jgi:hypothetical protein
MNTSVWGPIYWNQFYIIASCYEGSCAPQEKKDAIKKYFELMKQLLPCELCRYSFGIYTSQMPIDPYLESKDLLIFYIHTLQNRVSRKTLKYADHGSVRSLDQTLQHIEKLKNGKKIHIDIDL